METSKKWTSKEIEILVHTVKNSPYNLQECFRIVAKETGRTLGAVHFKWYNDIKYTAEGRKAMFTISKNKIYEGKIHRSNYKVNPIKVNLSKKLWATLIGFATKLTNK